MIEGIKNSKIIIKELKNTEKKEDSHQEGLNINSVTNVIGTNSNASLVLSFIIVITITYPFLISYIIPLLQ